MIGFTIVSVAMKGREAIVAALLSPEMLPVVDIHPFRNIPDVCVAVCFALLGFSFRLFSSLALISVEFSEGPHSILPS